LPGLAESPHPHSRDTHTHTLALTHIKRIHHRS